jgi:fatty-acyl-CoA synthase
MLLTRRAQSNADGFAFLLDGETTTYRDFNERSNQWANTLAECGISHGDRVGILLPNSEEFLEAYFGLAKIGVTLVPLNWRLAPTEVEYLCKDSRLDCLIYGESLTKTVDAIKSNLTLREYVCVGGTHPPNWARDLNFVRQHPTSEPKLEGGGDHPLLILYTSGTTGFLKGALLTHDNMLSNLVSQMAVPYLSLASEDRMLVVAPLFHLAGLFYAGIVDVYVGCATVLMTAFDPLKMLETILNYKVTAFNSVPTMLQRLAHIPNFSSYLSSVRWITVGSAPVPAPLIQTYLRNGIRIAQIYASTEAGLVSVMDPTKILEKPNSVGLPALNQEIRVVDETDLEVPLGEVGELLVRGPTVMKGYWNNPKATEEAIKDGWFHTGDLARLDEDGFLFLIDRKKDMIISGGENIYPVEIEKVLELHPKIAEAAVLGQPDEIWGESVCAVIRPKAGEKLTVDEVLDFCKGKLARFKMPRNVVFTKESLPVNQAGTKLDKRALRERLLSVKGS